MGGIIRDYPLEGEWEMRCHRDHRAADVVACTGPAPRGRANKAFDQRERLDDTRFGLGAESSTAEHRTGAIWKRARIDQDVSTRL